MIIEKEKDLRLKYFIKKLAKTLNLSLNKLNDLADIKKTPPDINEFINKSEIITGNVN